MSRVKNRATFKYDKDEELNFLKDLWLGNLTLEDTDRIKRARKISLRKKNKGYNELVRKQIGGRHLFAYKLFEGDATTMRTLTNKLFSDKKEFLSDSDTPFLLNFSWKNKTKKPGT